MVGLAHDIKALLLGLGAIFAIEMPFAKNARGVAGRLQRIGKGDVLGCETALVRHRNEALGFLGAAVRAADGIDVMTRRVGAGEQAGAARGRSCRRRRNRS
jgi:hypothetical protein